MRRKNKLVYGVGINDADYQVQKSMKINMEDGSAKRKSIWCCPFYRKWRAMLERCYSNKWLIKYPSYVDCEVCKEWYLFSTFKTWMEAQEFEGNQLDKDILGSGKLYSPETCCFIPGNINRFMTERQNTSSPHPLGVSKGLGSSKFVAQCYNGENIQIRLGSFSTPEEAHEVYKAFKLQVAIRLSASLPQTIAQAFISRYDV